MKYGAVIVAAGMSTRMKQFKQLMRIGDMSIAERVIVNYKRAGVGEIVMVTGHNADQLEKALRGFDIAFVRNDRYAETEMFDSARLGLEKINGKCDRLFFGPVDVPFFTDQTVSDLIAAMDENPSVKIVIPGCKGRSGHPILIDGSILPQILSHSGEMGMKGAIDSLPADSIARIEVPDEGAVTDADTMDDYRRLVDLHNDRILHPLIKLSFASTSAFFGPGTVDLLREIDKCGNVREACERCGFSYSKAWTIIKNCEEKFGYNIVERQAGGQTGGSASVTEKGRNLLSVYDELERELDNIAEKRFKELMQKYNLTKKQ